MVDIYRDAKRRGIYPPLFTDPEGDSCFSTYQIRWMKKKIQFVLRKLLRKDTPFSFRSQNSEYPRIFKIMGANQNVRKLLSTDLVNTNNNYYTVSDLVKMEACLPIGNDTPALLIFFKFSLKSSSSI